MQLSKRDINSCLLSFYQVDNENQQLLKEEGSKFRKGSVGVCYDSPETLLDAANYVKETCGKVIEEQQTVN